jgi:hypothetical protein
MALSEEIIRNPMYTGAWYTHRTSVERAGRRRGPDLALDAGNSVVAALERELTLTRELLEAERRRADRLDVLLAKERQASAELRRLLARVLGEPD